MADLGSGTLTIVGQCLNDHRHTRGAVAFVGNAFIAVRIARTQGPVNGTLDVIIRHIGSPRLGNHGRQAGVVGRITAAAGLHRHDHLFGDFSKSGGTLSILSALGLLNVMPFGMSRHSICPFMKKLLM